MWKNVKEKLSFVDFDQAWTWGWHETWWNAKYALLLLCINVKSTEIWQNCMKVIECESETLSYFLGLPFEYCSQFYSQEFLLRSLIKFRHSLIFIRPTCRDVLWYGAGVCLSVCPSVHKACRHDTEWTVQVRTVKLGTFITYDKRTDPINFQGQGSKVKVTCYSLM